MQDDEYPTETSNTLTWSVNASKGSFTLDEFERQVRRLAGDGQPILAGSANAATYWAVASAARRNGLPFVGHAPFGLAVDPAALADSAGPC